MTSVKRISDSIEIALSEEFLAADAPSELGSQIQPSALEDSFKDLYLSKFDKLVAKTQADYARYNTAMDNAMAIELHKALPLDRRQASDMRFWAWLGIVHAPDFVAWRWKPNGDPAKRTKARYFGDRVRQTFARLWWAAELTRDGSDYSLTVELLNQSGFQNNYEAIFGRAFGNYRPSMAAFIASTSGKNEAFIEQFAKQLGYALTTSVLETMSEEQLRALMSDLANRMEDKAA